MKNILAILILFSSAVAVAGWDTEYQNTPYAYKRFKFDAPGTNSAALGKCADWYELKSKELAAAGFKIVDTQCKNTDVYGVEHVEARVYFLN